MWSVFPFEHGRQCVPETSQAGCKVTHGRVSWHLYQVILQENGHLWRHEKVQIQKQIMDEKSVSSTRRKFASCDSTPLLNCDCVVSVWTKCNWLFLTRASRKYLVLQSAIHKSVFHGSSANLYIWTLRVVTTRELVILSGSFMFHSVSVGQPFTWSCKP